MPWLTNICNAVRFKPWFDIDRHVTSAASDVQSMIPETRQFLDLYLNSGSPAEPSHVSDEEDEDSIGTRQDISLEPRHDISIVDSVEIALAAFEAQHRYTCRRRIPVTSEHGQRYRPHRGGIGKPVTFTADFAVYPRGADASAAATSDNPHVLPVSSIKKTDRTSQFVPENTKTSSARAMAACYNDIFSDERYADPSRSEYLEIRSIMCIVGQAVTQALCSQSGCSGLTNGEEAILFRVERAPPPSDFNAKGSVHILVSRVFDRIEGTSSFTPCHALVGMTRHALSIVKEGPDTAGDVRDCALTVGNTVTIFSFDHRFARQGGYKYTGSTSPGRRSKRERIVQDLFQKHTGVVGVGGSAVVLASEWNGRRVAIKFWNEVEMDGLTELVDEIHMYGLLRTRHPEILGLAVPKPILLRSQPTHEALLVTEYFGSGVKRQDDGAMMVQNGNQWEVVDEIDRDSIMEAARRSLDALHSCGISHGDIALRNLRVERIVDDLGMVGWKAVWIDLGHAEEVSEDEYGFEVDQFQFVNGLEKGELDL